MNFVDENAFLEQIFDIIEPVLEVAGYKVLDGDATTAYIVSPDGKTHFAVKLQMCNS